MIVAIIGSRDFDRLDLVVDYVKALPKGTTVVSGGARGVDRIATLTAHSSGLTTRVWYPDWEGEGKGAGFARNSRIVDDCERLVAFWDGQSRGTLDSLKKAKAAGKPAEVRRADGSCEAWPDRAFDLLSERIGDDEAAARTGGRPGEEP